MKLIKINNNSNINILLSNSQTLPNFINQNVYFATYFQNKELAVWQWRNSLDIDCIQQAISQQLGVDKLQRIEIRCLNIKNNQNVDLEYEQKYKKYQTILTFHNESIDYIDMCQNNIICLTNTRKISLFNTHSGISQSICLNKQTSFIKVVLCENDNSNFYGIDSSYNLHFFEFQKLDLNKKFPLHNYSKKIGINNNKYRVIRLSGETLMFYCGDEYIYLINLFQKQICGSFYIENLKLNLEVACFNEDIFVVKNENLFYILFCNQNRILKIEQIETKKQNDFENIKKFLNKFNKKEIKKILKDIWQIKLIKVFLQKDHLKFFQKAFDSFDQFVFNFKNYLNLKIVSSLEKFELEFNELIQVSVIYFIKNKPLSVFYIIKNIQINIGCEQQFKVYLQTIWNYLPQYDIQVAKKDENYLKIWSFLSEKLENLNFLHILQQKN